MFFLRLCRWFCDVPWLVAVDLLTIPHEVVNRRKKRFLPDLIYDIAGYMEFVFL